MPRNSVSGRLRISTYMLGVVVALACGGLILASVVFPYRKLPDKATSYLQDLPHYPFIQSLVLAVVTVDPSENENAIWLIRMSNSGPTDYYKLIGVHLDNESVGASSSSADHIPFYIVPCASVSRQLCVVEQAGNALDDRGLKLHRWTIDWSSDSEPSVRSEEQVFTLPSDVTVTGVISTGLYYDESGSTYFLGFADTITSPIATINNSTKCSSSSLSPLGNFISYLCHAREDFGKPADPYTSTQQHLHLVQTNDLSQRRLAIADKETYYVEAGVVCKHMYPVTRPKYAWTSNESQIAFVTALEPPICRCPNYACNDDEDWGAIYSLSLKDQSWHEWAWTFGGHPALAWSPDNRFIAYGLGNKLNLVSSDREQRTIREYDDFLDDVMWSSDGSYIAVKHTSYIAAKHISRLEIIRTSDYAPQSVDLPGEVSEMIWVTP